MGWLSNIFTKNTDTTENKTDEQKKSVGSLPSLRDGWNYITEPFTGAFQRNIEARRDDMSRFHAVFACTTLIASDVSKLSLNLRRYENGIQVDASQRYIDALLDNPNSYQTRQQFLESWVLSKVSYGNAYILKDYDAAGNVIELHVINPERITLLVSPDTQEIFYQIGGDQQDVASITDQNTFPARMVIHDRYNCLHHPLVGVSPLSAAALPASNGLELQKSQTHFAKNQARPSVVLSTPNELDREKALEMKKAWEQKFTGNNVGGVAILENGLTATTIQSISAADQQAVEQMKMSVTAICSVFHVPESMIGAGNETYSNAEVRTQQYYQQCLQTYIEAIETCLERGLGIGRRSTSGLVVKFNLDELFKLDSASLIEYTTKAIGGGVMTVNEARSKHNLRPVDGGDSVYMQQQNYSLEALNKRDAQDDPFNNGSNKDNNNNPQDPRLNANDGGEAEETQE